MQGVGVVNTLDLLVPQFHPCQRTVGEIEVAGLQTLLQNSRIPFDIEDVRSIDVCDPVVGIVAVAVAELLRLPFLEQYAVHIPAD